MGSQGSVLLWVGLGGVESTLPPRKIQEGDRIQGRTPHTNPHRTNLSAESNQGTQSWPEHHALL